MKTESNLHVPFRELRPEALFVIFIVSQSSLVAHRNWRPSTVELRRIWESVWNAEKLTLADLNDWERLHNLLEAHLAKYTYAKRRRRSSGIRAHQKSPK